MKRRGTSLGLLLALPLAASSPVRAVTCAPRLSGVTGPAAASSIKLVGADGGGGIHNDAMANAGDTWHNGCSGYENPQFQLSGTADMVVQVNFMGGKNDGRVTDCNDRCGCAKAQISGGKIVGAMVYVFQQEATGADCTSSYTGVLAHELGHVLGLADTTASACNGRIMATVGGAITADECISVDNNFRTGAENPDGSDRDPVHCY